ncbi:amino acid ABC transporter ATP-binding protein [Microbacterium sp.]|uniref:amino acid ABC transporter ATP-binding protein n=1 Tax=Microbacterium sp. TaxID=51671 RepID=UPI00092BF58E|nr:amino acid ABC transporter ATP-binding protein [Microbacterium sp.]MBN9193999.1 amino acid ABC transporter ATP-binding protein [Microbacterium sp.]OJU57126.1 MAG: ectoine/hydroxyectoine ABC transporter ATP-binding protein EhuA [Microbacterium sp. 70-38]
MSAIIATTSTSVTVEDVRKSYHHHEVLKGVSFTVPANTVTSILGPSGSGKSTLLRCINRLIPIDGGTIRVGDQLIGYENRGGRYHELSDRDLCRQRQRIGMVFQNFNLFPHMTVLANLVEGPQVVQRRPRRETETEARELLALVGLAEKADQYPGQLSGGQQQRVAIARALAMKPELILFDEPTSALDPELVGEVLDVMRRLADEARTTMIVVTHEIGFAREVSDQVVFMADGVVEAAGAPTVVLDPDHSPRIRSFLARGLH